MSTDEAAQRLEYRFHYDDCLCVGDNLADCDCLATYDVRRLLRALKDGRETQRALLAERATLHARIRDVPALRKAISLSLAPDGQYWASTRAADAVVAYLTGAPDGAAT